jgi:hypothetical protein
VDYQQGFFQSAFTGPSEQIGVIRNGTTAAPFAAPLIVNTSSGNLSAANTFDLFPPLLGTSYIQAMECGSGTGNSTFVGGSRDGLMVTLDL